MRIEFFIKGTPVALKRHRRTTIKEKTWDYDPSSSDKKNFLIACLNFRPPKPIDFPVRITLVFNMPRPKNHYNKAGLKNDSPKYHSVKPDIDNLVKFVFDALNGKFWKDDSCISVIIAEKKYSETEGIYILITEA